MGPRCLSPWTNQWQSREPLGQRRPQSLSSASSAAWSNLGRYSAPPKLLNFTGPYFCQLSAVAAAANLVEGKDGQCRVPASPLPSFDLIPILPSLRLPRYSSLGLTVF